MRRVSFAANILDVCAPRKYFWCFGTVLPKRNLYAIIRAQILLFDTSTILSHLVVQAQDFRGQLTLSN